MSKQEQAQMTCDGCGVQGPMRGTTIMRDYVWRRAWLGPKEWVDVRDRYYCKSCIDAFEVKGSEG